jgi:putative transcriptional regulator
MKNKIIGKCLLPELLKRRGMTQVDLAVMTDISTTQINEYISGTRKMSLANAKLIAHVLNCHIDDLYKWNL